GRVRNDSRGVTIEAFGLAAALDAFVERLTHDGSRPAAAVIDRVDEESIAFEQTDGVAIVHSARTGEPPVAIPPDLPASPASPAEGHAPAARRFGYAFTSCTNCGPRFTIVRSAPSARPATTMAAFPMCPECRGEYESVEDRRFHAQPN